MLMPMPPTVSSLGVDDIDGVPDAAALLADAHYTHPTGRLLGSITPSGTAYTVASFMAVVRISKRRGRVDLVHHHGQITGVACWITHSAHRRAHRSVIPAPPTELKRHRPVGLVDDVHHSITRLDMLDLALAVPDDSTHLHLACLGTRASYSARMTADLLLYHQHQRADRDGLTLYIEVHSHRDRTWLHRLGYHDLGPTLGHRPEAQSHGMTRIPHPGAHGLPTPAPPSSSSRCRAPSDARHGELPSPED